MPFLPSDTPAPLNPWTSMWLKPRQTINYLLATNPERGILTLAMLGGVMLGINDALGRIDVEKDLSVSEHWFPSLLITLFFFAFAALIGLFIGSWLMSATGKWIDGKASAATMRTVYAWAQLPFAWVFPLWLVLTAIAGKELFFRDPEAGISPPVAIAVMVVGWATIIAGVWSVVLYVIADRSGTGILYPEIDWQCPSLLTDGVRSHADCHYHQHRYHPACFIALQREITSALLTRSRQVRCVFLFNTRHLS